MKPLSFGLLLCATLLLAFTSKARCAYDWRCIYLYDGRRIVALSDNEHRGDYYPKISNSGQVVWMGSSEDTHVYLYDGNTTRVVSQGVGVNPNYIPDINDMGVVVWDDRYEVYMSDGVNRTNISSRPGRDENPKINDHGVVVWQGCDTADCSYLGDGDYEIFLYDGTSTTQLTNNGFHDENPQINNNGYVVWNGGMCKTEVCKNTIGDGDHEIFLYDGTTIMQITDNDYREVNPKINEMGQVVWEGCDTEDCGVGGDGDYEIFLYDGSTVTQITVNDYEDYGPNMNDSGHVVWNGGSSGSYSADLEIYLYNGTAITQITDNDYGDVNPKINDSGQIVWDADDGVSQEIYLYDGAAVTKLTEHAYGDYDPDINDDGMIVWTRVRPPYSPWTEATVAGTEAASNPSRLNYILAIVLPIGMIFLMRGLRRNRV
jgi:hypothetical protein